MIQDVDFIAFDNSEPPQLWAWAGEPDDETSEALFRLPMAGIGDQFLRLVKDVDRLEKDVSFLRRKISEELGPDLLRDI